MTVSTNMSLLYNVVLLHSISRVFKLIITYKRYVFGLQIKLVLHTRYDLNRGQPTSFYIIFSVSVSVLVIRTLTLLFAASWRCDRSYRGLLSNFDIQRHHFMTMYWYSRLKQLGALKNENITYNSIPNMDYNNYTCN